MQILINILLVFEVLISLIIILLVLMQRPKNEGLGAAFGGGMTENLFGAQATNVLQKLTRNLGITFFILTALISWLYVKQGHIKSDVQKQLASVPPPAAPPVPATPAPAPVLATPAPGAPGAASAPISLELQPTTPGATPAPGLQLTPATPAPASAPATPSTPAPAPAPAAAAPATPAPAPAPAAATPAPAPTAATPAPATPAPQQ